MGEFRENLSAGGPVKNPPFVICEGDFEARIREFLLEAFVGALAGILAETLLGPVAATSGEPS